MSIILSHSEVLLGHRRGTQGLPVPQIWCYPDYYYKVTVFWRRKKRHFFFSCYCVKGNSHMISPDRTRLISILLSNSRLPGHLSPDLWHSMLIILILFIHATTRQQWNASWQSKRRRSAQILSTAIVTVALATQTGMKRVGTRPDGRRCHVPVWKRWNTASYIFGSRMLI